MKNGKVLPLQKTYSNVKGKEWWTSDKTVTKNELAHREYEKILREMMRDPRNFDRWLDTETLEHMESMIIPKISFAYHDINGDKVDELLVRMGSIEEDNDSNVINILYSFHNNHDVIKIYEVVPIDYAYSFERLEIMFDKPYIKEIFHPGITFRAWKYYKLKQGKLLDEVKFSYHKGGEVEDYRIVKRQTEIEVDIETLNKADEKYKSRKIVKTIPLTDANLKKHRKTYNSTDFREYKNY